MFVFCQRMVVSTIIKYWVATLIATPRHMSRLLRLLPSGSGRVHRVSLRGDQKGHHNVLERSIKIIVQGRELWLIKPMDASTS